MPLFTSLSQTSLAAAMLAAAAGNYVAISSPNPDSKLSPAATDTVHWLKMTGKQVGNIAIAPIGLLTAHASILAYRFPNIHSSLLGHGPENGLNMNLFIWSKETAIPLALVLCAGIPLRLCSYRSLGKSFTFQLTKPDRLVTDGIYNYVQHPSYTGGGILTLCNIFWLLRPDGVMSCWLPPWLYKHSRYLGLSAHVVMTASLFAGMMWTRIKEEETMLRAEFGAEWEHWHDRTPRFLPFLF